MEADNERTPPKPASSTIRIARSRVLAGPNIHHHRAVVVATVQTDGASEPPVEARRRLRRRLVALLPGIATHRCDAGHEGGFLDAVHAGTTLAHIVEHVALELSELAGIGVDFGRTIADDRPGSFTVVVRARAPRTMERLIEEAAAVVETLLNDGAVDLAAILERAEAVRAATELGPGMQGLVLAAERRGIPTMRVGDEGLVQLGFGARRRLAQATAGARAGIGTADSTKTHLERTAATVRGADVACIAHGREWVADVGEAIVELLFPDGAAARIPLVTITGTNGKTTVTRMIDHILRADGHVTGMTTTDGIWIDGTEVMRGDMTGPFSAQVVLGDPSVQIAVLETARGGIARRGLGYDWSDVGVLTNVTSDHIGQDGIHSVDDLLEIKALVAERVRPGGRIVLNADDRRLVALAARPSLAGRTIVFFSMHADSRVVDAHVASGGIAYVLDGDAIVELAAGARCHVASLARLPITLGGAADFQVANALAAIAAACALGVGPSTAARSLESFRSDVHNPGRMNLYAVGRGYVLIDYGHNPDAFGSVARLAAHWADRRRTGIVGVPGDRDDETITESGRIVARAFDRVIVREDHDLRGRASGETSAMLGGIIADVAQTIECLTVLDERDALRHAIATMEPGEIIVLFYEKLEPVLEELAAHGAVAAGSVGSAEASGVARPAVV